MIQYDKFLHINFQKLAMQKMGFALKLMPWLLFYIYIYIYIINNIKILRV